MSQTRDNDRQLNAMILEGKILEAFDLHYADDVVMQENGNEPLAGKEPNRKKEQDFVDSIETFHGAELGATAVDGDVSFAEWIFDVTFKGSERTKLDQVAVRRWKDGKVVHERFLYDTAS